MDKKLVEYFIMEQKIEQEWKERWNANHIDFDNYFKYSGCTEEPVFIERNKCTVKITTDCPIVEFFHENPQYSMQEMGQVFGISYSSIKKALDNYYWAHQSNNFKDYKYESRITKTNENQ
tara:strand:- start:764 stop:1123 length:360 start_codon:yes stop_codon:yes gene_type:complete